MNNGICYDSATVHGFTLRLSGSPEHEHSPGATGLPYSTVLDYGQGAVAVMAAYDFSRTFDESGQYGRQRLNADVNYFASLGADYSLSRRITLYASLGNKRDAHRVARTAFGVGLAHAF